MGSIGSIYVECRGDTTGFERDIKTLRSIAKKGGTEVSNALNNAINPAKAERGMKDLSESLIRLSQSAKAPADNFTKTSAAIAKGMEEAAKKIGITEEQFRSLNDKMLRNQAMATAEASLKAIGRAAGLSSEELKKLAVQLGHSANSSLVMGEAFQKAHIQALAMNKALDKAKVEAVANSAQKIADKLDQAHIQALAMNKAFDKAKVEAVASSAQKIADKLEQAHIQALAMNKSFDKARAEAVANSTQKMAQKLEQAHIQALAMNKSFDKARVEAVANSAQKIAQKLDQAHIQALAMNKAFDKARAKANEIKMPNILKSMNKVRNTLLNISVLAAAVIYPIKQMSEALWEAGRATKVSENAYKEITGSVANANVQFQFLRKTADELGLNFYTLREGYKGFLAAAQTSKLPMQEVQQIFKSVSNAGAVLGLSNERMSLSFLALEQMMSKGKVSMEEIRRQLGDNIPGAFQLGAKAMGMTVEAFDKAVSAGEVFSDDFLPKFRKALDENFKGGIDESVKAANKLAESFEELKNRLAASGFMDAITDSIKLLTETLSDPDVQKGLTTFANLLGEIVFFATSKTSDVIAFLRPHLILRYQRYQQLKTSLVCLLPRSMLMWLISLMLKPNSARQEKSMRKGKSGIHGRAPVEFRSEI